MGKALFAKIKEALISVLPVSVIVAVLYFSPLVSLTDTELVVFLVSSVVLIIGIGLFNLGADMAMTPMGEHIGAGLTRTGSLALLLSVSFLMGLLITIAEPDLTVLAAQVKDVISETLLVAVVGIGVGFFLILAVVKIILRKQLSSLLMFFYLLMFALASLVVVSESPEFLPMAFDSGGVTTGPITVPFIMALGVGIASTLGGKDTGENSFGLIALCSVGPILAVMVAGITSNGELTYSLPDYSVEANLGTGLLRTILSVVEEVAIALGLIVIFFIILQAVCLKLPKRHCSGSASG